MCEVITKDRNGDERLAGSSNEGENQGFFFEMVWICTHKTQKQPH